MEDELAQLDELIESDVLDALGEEIPPELQEEKSPSSAKEIDGIVMEDLVEEKHIDDEQELEENWESELEAQAKENLSEVVVSENKIEMGSSDLASLLTQLLKNKTIEITIKIKD